MKALIAFIILAVVVLTLTEVNERIKAKKNNSQPNQTLKEEAEKDEDCETKTDGDCSACELISVCEKKAEN